MQPFNPRPMGEYVTEQNAPGMHGYGAPPDPSMGGMGSLVQYPVGAYGGRRPRGSAMKVAAAISPLMGALGDAADAVAQKQEANTAGESSVGAGIALAAIFAGLVLRGGAGYLVGRQLAPRGEETAYAWGGVAASILFGSLGLGVEALIASNAD